MKKLNLTGYFLTLLFPIMLFLSYKGEQTLSYLIMLIFLLSMLFRKNRSALKTLVDEKIAGFNREELRLKLAENDIESRPLWKPMHLQPVFANSPYYGGNVAETLFNDGLCLPSGANLRAEDRARISRVIKSVISK